MSNVEQINDFRRKILAGEEVPKDDLRGAISALVGERLTAHAQEKPKTKAPAKAVNLDDLL